ncbi:LADA_0G13388g1_1 [Lachancea dasiensis]|uniref:Kynurenine formamidase n=1 Tax=Lachancea dasiensis TaxID=1072105 RepID=A0A1G4JVL2_9SACH|nr:LADA_0G13388g1_1 [Lachancea dasiensis]
MQPVEVIADVVEVRHRRLETNSNTFMAKFDQTATFHKSVAPGNHKAIVFIHGGAWIDPSNTPQDFEKLAKHLLALTHSQPTFSLYAIEYRLSPEVKHPVHIQDVAENIAELIKLEKIDELHILGHSVGATLAWQLLSMPLDNQVVNSLQLGHIRSILKQCFLVDGIFSLTELLLEYPTYDYFVFQAFNSTTEYDDPKSSSLDIPSDVELHILHSYRDELLSLRQSNYLCHVLQARHQPFQSYWTDMGKHNDVYESLTLAKYILCSMTRQVSKDK